LPYHRNSASPHIRERARDLEEHHAASLSRALAAGVKIAAGTDAGGHGHPPNALEIACLVRPGMAPLQALRAATGWAAECFGRDHDIGTVEPGKLADLVVVRGEPLADVGTLQDREQIALVLKGGAIAANRLSAAAKACAAATRPLALVTGASSGVGRELARELASDAAIKFFDDLPKLEALMPPLKLGSIEEMVKPRRARDRYSLSGIH
jgi:hypothetical protein